MLKNYGSLKRIRFIPYPRIRRQRPRKFPGSKPVTLFFRIHPTPLPPEGTLEFEVVVSTRGDLYPSVLFLKIPFCNCFAKIAVKNPKNQNHFESILRP